jgi:hypothetical protein
MPVELADIEQVRMLAATMTPTDELWPLATASEVFAYIATRTRATGGDEGDAAELLARAGEMTPDELRRIVAVLQPLGYVAVCTRLKALAGRRKRSLSPLR